MFRAVVVGNRVIYKRQVLRQQQVHKRNISTAKCTFRQGSEERGLNNRKRELQLQERFTEIERENRLLLEKITSVMGKSTSLRKKGPRKSLNWTTRRDRLLHIEHENLKMLRRLQGQKSDYRAERLQQQWCRNRTNIIAHTQLPVKIASLRPTSNVSRRRGPVSIARESEERVLLSKQIQLGDRRFVVDVVRKGRWLSIEGLDLNDQQLKVIEISWEEAKTLIQKYGGVQQLLDQLCYQDDKICLYG